ncbi:MAG: hypothetical protein IMY79_02960 [Chloroflexi bacterium]|nr:hypothetical protein [Chloroflexota bacterium]
MFAGSLQGGSEPNHTGSWPEPGSVAEELWLPIIRHVKERLVTREEAGNLHITVKPAFAYVAAFLVESGFMGGITGSCGQVHPWIGPLWHAELVQCKWHDQEKVPILLIYLSCPEETDFWKEQESLQTAATDIAETLILPLVFRHLGEIRAPEAMLKIRFLSSVGYGADGRFVGGDRSGLARWQVGITGSLEIYEFAKLKLHPEVQRALRHFDRGIRAASDRQYGDACMNYCRSLELLFGSHKRGWKAIEKHCEDLHLDFSKVRHLMEKVRGKYAVAHVRDWISRPFAKPKMKTEPDWRIESEARHTCREAIKAFWESLPQLTDLDALPFEYLYHDTRYLSPNMPEPEEAIAKLGLKAV